MHGFLQRLTGLTIGGMAVLAVIFGAPSAQATYLGYGELIGTWDTQQSPYPNPTGNNVTTWGNLILAVTPGAFDINDFHLAGDTGDWADGTFGALTFDKIDGFNGNWTYNGGVNNDQPVDLYLAVKYGTWVSVFFYDDVQVGDTGSVSSNGAVLGLPYCTAAQTADDFETGCIGNNGHGRPQGISHVVGYWPPGDITQQVPEPASLALLGVGLFGIGVARRYRRRPPAQ